MDNLALLKTKYIETNSESTELDSFFKSKEPLSNFNIEVYTQLLDLFGLEKTWNALVDIIKNSTIDDLNKSFIKFDDIGELYEFGLAHTNKISKKEMGKYYTPNDVSIIMSQLLLENNAISNLVDVAAGTGNLVLAVLRQMLVNGNDIYEFIKKRKLWIYDVDKIALNICTAKIQILVGKEVLKYINVVVGDFLSSDIVLPKNATVITNPPYSQFKEFNSEWEKTDVLSQSKDLYAGFMDKILDSCKSAVIVTPQSYLVSDKFSKLRLKLASNFYGEIFAFDNVPGTLFNGRKHGIFNTNTSNGVRAAIASIKKNGHQGFKLSHLIRFRTDQREDIMNLSFLRSKLGNKIQDLKTPIKSFKELEPFVEKILDHPHTYVSQLLETSELKKDNNYRIYVSSSARYFTVGSIKKLDRVGCYEIYAKDEQSHRLLYALLNSSYMYMWWRFFDGGILFSKRSLFRTPISNELINSEKITIIQNLINEMIENESNYLTYKRNAGKSQESIKFPVKFRNEINKQLFDDFAEYFDLLHNNYEVKK